MTMHSIIEECCGHRINHWLSHGYGQALTWPTITSSYNHKCKKERSWRVPARYGMIWINRYCNQRSWGVSWVIQPGQLGNFNGFCGGKPIITRKACTEILQFWTLNAGVLPQLRMLLGGTVAAPFFKQTSWQWDANPERHPSTADSKRWMGDPGGCRKPLGAPEFWVIYS